MTEVFQTTEQLVPVLTTEELLDKAAAMGSVIAREERDVQPTADELVVIDKRAQAREEAARKALVAHNVTNLVAANWWHAQAAEQRGDHVAAAQHGIARGRLMAVAKAEGLRLG